MDRTAVAPRSMVSPISSEVPDILGDLVRETLSTLLPVTLCLSWLWLAFSILRGDDTVGRPYLVLGILLLAALISYRSARAHLDLAVAVYVAALFAAVTIIADTYRGGDSLYLYVLVVLVTGMLTDARALWITALASSVLILGIGLHNPKPGITGLLLPIVYVLLTALMAWVSSHRLFTALAWALTMTRESEKNAREARERRAEVLRVLKSLDEAYVRLEWANEALIFAREAAQKAYRFKSEFVANVSHELRTPLNLIVGFSEMMATAPESYKGAALPSEYRGDVMAIYRSARHLSDLINDVLDLSKIEAGRLPLNRELADLTEIISEAVEMVRGLAEPKGLRLEVRVPEAPLVLFLDRTRIRQVLLNLLTNAVRFTDAGWIRVEVTTTPAETTVTVTDSGRGIAPERLAQAFETFSQLHDDQAREGNGLGLALSKKFVELHGGTMWIQSALGEGTTVGFTLPTARGEAVPVTPAGTAWPPGRGELPHVLVLHDDPRVVSVLQHYIEGYRFIVTASPGDALALVRETGPAAVIADTGWIERQADGLITAVQELAPVITCHLPSLRQLGLLLGATDYLVKPISRADLLAALERLGRRPESVLLIDDDPGFVRLLARVLTANDPGLRILEASSALEGLEIARSQRPDLILVDLLIPGFSGYDFLEAIRRDERLRNIDVIAMSARDIDEEASLVIGELRLDTAAGLTMPRLAQGIQALLAMVTTPALLGGDGGRGLRGNRPAERV
ncbi:MAG: response regulator [Chloroflexi bacterium]|nr:response regulator [Chloroflexota bacterium]